MEIGPPMLLKQRTEYSRPAMSEVVVQNVCICIPPTIKVKCVVYVKCHQGRELGHWILHMVCLELLETMKYRPSISNSVNSSWNDSWYKRHWLRFFHQLHFFIKNFVLFYFWNTCTKHIIYCLYHILGFNKFWLSWHKWYTC